MKPPIPSPPPRGASAFASLLEKALERRRPLLKSGATQAFRIFSGEADGLDGVFVDVYAQGAVLIVYEGRAPRAFNASTESQVALRVLAPLGVRAVYFKPFAKDRSKMGGELPRVTTDPAPAAGEPLPESLLIREHIWNLEVRLYDGFSTGLFLDQRENRKFVHDWVNDRLRSTGAPPVVLNTFAYTCAFSVAAAIAGAHTASVDVSPRYLDWGKRNFEHNKLDPSRHRFARMDTFEFFGYAKRKNLKFDMIILDPPSFSAGSKKKGIRPWSSIADYARLVGNAAAILNPKGVLFASTNTQELCRPGRFEREIEKGLGRPARYLRLPDMPLDFAKDRDRFTALAFAV